MKKEDFLTAYAAYSTADLLKITLLKDSYQPMAIEAAQEILATRNINEEDRIDASTAAEVETEINERNNKKVESIQSRFVLFIDEYFGLKERTDTKNLNVLCVFLAIMWIYRMLTTRVLLLLFELGYRVYYTLLLVFVECLPILFIVLLYKRKKIGWMLAVVYYTFQLFASTYVFGRYYALRNEDPIFRRDLSPEVITIGLSFAILFFLNKAGVMSQFTFTRSTRKDSFIIAGIFCFIFVVWSELSLY